MVPLPHPNAQIARAPRTRGPLSRITDGLHLMPIQIQRRIKLRLLRHESLSVARRQEALAIGPLHAGGVA